MLIRLIIKLCNHSNLKHNGTNPLRIRILNTLHTFGTFWIGNRHWIVPLPEATYLRFFVHINISYFPFLLIITILICSICNCSYPNALAIISSEHGTQWKYAFHALTTTYSLSLQWLNKSIQHLWLSFQLKNYRPRITLLMLFILI